MCVHLRHAPHCGASQLRLVEGDISLPRFGIDDTTLSTMQQHVQLFFHLAATVEFNLPLDEAVKMNCVGALNAIEVSALPDQA